MIIIFAVYSCINFNLIKTFLISICLDNFKRLNWICD